MTLYDHALEANRRAAWARFYEAREDLRTLAGWAAELGAYIDELVPSEAQPDALIELRRLVDAHVDDVTRRIVRRFVLTNLDAALAVRRLAPLGIATA